MLRDHATHLSRLEGSRRFSNKQSTSLSNHLIALTRLNAHRDTVPRINSTVPLSPSAWLHSSRTSFRRSPLKVIWFSKSATLLRQGSWSILRFSATHPRSFEPCSKESFARAWELVLVVARHHRKSAFQMIQRVLSQIFVAYCTIIVGGLTRTHQVKWADSG